MPSDNVGVGIDRIRAAYLQSGGRVSHDRKPAGEPPVKIAFMPDTHFGEYDQVEPPTPDQVADAMEHCIAEAELAEKVGFDGIWVPERHQRPEILTQRKE